MESKLLLGLLYLDKKFTSPFEVEKYLPHIELVLKLAEQKEEYTPQEEKLLKKLLYKLDRFEEFVKERKELLSAKFKLEGRL